MSETKVYLLDFGTIALDGFMMYWNRGPSGPIRFPAYGVLIDHAEGRFIFDTGFDLEWFDQHLPGLAHQSERQTVPGQLDLLGLRPSDITHVINSHCHVDHVGGNKCCTHATTLCHKHELEAVRRPEPWEAMGYSDRSFAAPEQLDPAITPTIDDAVQDIYTPRFELLNGDEEVARGVTLFETPGHTPGHYSLLVRLANRRPMLFTGDACYTKRSIEENIISGAHSDVSAAHASMQRLRDLAEQHDAELFYSHDAAAWANWRPAPHFYS